VPRTVNRVQHTVRRDAFLDVAQRLIQTKGYEAMSVQDVLDELGTSKGAFYHYFDSKQALLEAVVERFADAATATLAPVLDDPEMPAIRKLEHYFTGIATWKTERKDLTLAIMEVWLSDKNTVVREMSRRMGATRVVPVLTAVIAQGTAEGVFRTGSPRETAIVLASLIHGLQELAGEQYVARQAGAIPFEAVERSIGAFTRAFERILGLAEGSLTLTDESTLHFWFG